MRISVERIINDDDHLVFTIKILEPHLCPMVQQEIDALEGIDNFTKGLERNLDPEGKLYQNILLANHQVKERIFLKTLENIKFSIKNELEPKFHPICQEIYNWIYDKQEGSIKKWMQEFDATRTTYYFDNDIKLKNQLEKNIPDDKFDDEDEDED